MEKRNKLWVLLGILILALLNFPLLTIVNRDLCYGGIPLLIYYFFGVWVLAIVGLFNQTIALADGFQIEPDVLPPWD